MKKTLREYIRTLRGEGRAIPAFNYSDVWDLKAIAEIGAETGVSLMVASNPLVAHMLGVNLCSAMAKAVAEQLDAVLYHHLDHSREVELCIQAIDAGYDSVMIDGSDRDLDTNIRMVKEVVAYAHPRNVMVEAEIGRIKGRGIEGDMEDEDFLASVSDAAEMVERTGVDALAVGIGTAHGFYTRRPEIHFDRLEEIAARVTTPLVLHGGTGIPDEDIRRAITLGITKVNVGTIIHVTYMGALKDTLERIGERPYTLDVMKEVLPSIKRVLAERIDVISQQEVGRNA